MVLSAVSYLAINMAYLLFKMNNVIIKTSQLDIHCAFQVQDFFLM